MGRKSHDEWWTTFRLDIILKQQQRPIMYRGVGLLHSIPQQYIWEGVMALDDTHFLIGRINCKEHMLSCFVYT